MKLAVEGGSDISRLLRPHKKKMVIVLFSGRRWVGEAFFIIIFLIGEGHKE
jgi:hypothetical protein